MSLVAAGGISHGHRKIAEEYTMTTHMTTHMIVHMTIRPTILRSLIIGSIAVALSGAAAITTATAQQAPAPVTQGASNIKRTILQKFDVPGTDRETVIGIAEIVPNAMIGKHTHAGVESGYMLEGEMVLMVAGQPDKIVKAGDSYQIGLGLAHDGKSGPAGAKVIATYVVEKGKPLATPAP
jgi:quercetin dioxygenase-like cupin family protein